MVVAKGILKKVYLSHLLVGHIYDDIEFLSSDGALTCIKMIIPPSHSPWNSTCKWGRCPPFHMLLANSLLGMFLWSLKSVMETNILFGHTKARQFRFFVHDDGWPMVQFKILNNHEEWLPKEGMIMLKEKPEVNLQYQRAIMPLLDHLRWGTYTKSSMVCKELLTIVNKIVNIIVGRMALPLNFWTFVKETLSAPLSVFAQMKWICNNGFGRQIKWRLVWTFDFLRLGNFGRITKLTTLMWGLEVGSLYLHSALPMMCSLVIYWLHVPNIKLWNQPIGVVSH